MIFTVIYIVSTVICGWIAISMLVYSHRASKDLSLPFYDSPYGPTHLGVFVAGFSCFPIINTVIAIVGIAYRLGVRFEDGE